MKQRLLALILLNAAVITTSLPVCAYSPPQPIAQSKTRDARADVIFVLHTNEFWLNLHHFLYVLRRAAPPSSLHVF